MSSYTSDKPISPPDDHSPTATPEPVVAPGSAGFQAKYLARDVQAGIICGAMAIPLSTGIAMMSEYPIKVALATVVFACFIGWINSFFRPGNYIGVPGVAAGLAPALALGVQSFGVENMAFCIFLTAAIQAANLFFLFK
jgi:MFS superfamily sulfate permease-like transporter